MLAVQPQAVTLLDSHSLRSSFGAFGIVLIIAAIVVVLLLPIALEVRRTVQGAQ